MAANPPAPPQISGSRAQQIQEIEAWIEVRTGSSQLGQSYVTYCGKHPHDSAKECYIGWFIVTSKIFPDLFKDIGTGLGTGGQLVTSTEGALGTLGGFLGELSSAALWERVLLVGLGVVLVAVGVAELTKAVPGLKQTFPVATKIAKAVR